MPRYRRRYGEGGTFAFTVCLKDRSARFLTDRVEDLRAAFRGTFARYPVRIDAICVLPDHLHTIWTLPDGDTDYPLRWQLIKKHFNRSVGAQVWQRRYWEHTIRSDEDLANHVNYIHFNPVKHGHARTMDAWPYSTWHHWKAENGKAWSPPPEDMYL